MSEEIRIYCIRCQEYHPLIDFEGASLDEHEMYSLYPKKRRKGNDTLDY